METIKLISDFKYCFDLHRYKRISTRRVNIGDIPLGSIYPIRIQSMTTTNTMDTKGCLEATKTILMKEFYKVKRDHDCYAPRTIKLDRPQPDGGQMMGWCEIVKLIYSSEE